MGQVVRSLLLGALLVLILGMQDTARQAHGACPVIKKGTAGACLVDCPEPNACEPGYTCCSNGCGRTCVADTKG